MSGLQVVVTDHKFPDLKQERDVLEPIGFSFKVGQCTEEEEVIHLARQADAILTQFAPITAKVIEQLEKCKIIVRYGIGVDNVDVEAAKKKNIPVVNIPDYAIQEVADHAFSLLLSSVRKIPQVVSQVRQGKWDIAPRRPIMGLQGKILGLAGFGNIARAVAKRAQAFGLETIAYDPFVKEDQFQALNVQKVEWDQLLEKSDIISVHLPLTKDTRHVFQIDSFSKMKTSSFIINTSRGGVIHTNDLVTALHNNEIAGAALDVLEHEPIAVDHPLLQMDQCLVTSHCAWYSESSLQRLQLFAALEIKRLFTGEKPKSIVNQ